MKTGIELITEERKEQIEKHKWTLQHDIDEHYDGDLIRAAIAIAVDVDDWLYYGIDKTLPFPTWAIDIRKKISNDKIHSLKVAGALIAAEIDRILNK